MTIKKISQTLKQLIKFVKISSKIKSYNIKFEKKLIHKNLGLNKRYFKDKFILDTGTGVGRNEKIFSSLSARKNIAVNNKLTIKNLNEPKIKNVIYKEGNVLNLKFKKTVFDFVSLLLLVYFFYLFNFIYFNSYRINFSIFFKNNTIIGWKIFCSH